MTSIKGSYISLGMLDHEELRMVFYAERSSLLSQREPAIVRVLTILGRNSQGIYTTVDTYEITRKRRHIRRLTTDVQFIESQGPQRIPENAKVGSLNERFFTDALIDVVFASRQTIAALPIVDFVERDAATKLRERAQTPIWSAKIVEDAQDRKSLGWWLSAILTPLGVIGGPIAMAQLLSDIIGWRGPIEFALDYWKVYVSDPFHVVIAYPFSMIGISLPPWTKWLTDYVALGLLLASSFARAALLANVPIGVTYTGASKGLVIDAEIVASLQSYQRSLQRGGPQDPKLDALLQLIERHKGIMGDAEYTPSFSTRKFLAKAVPIAFAWPLHSAKFFRRLFIARFPHDRIRYAVTLLPFAVFFCLWLANSVFLAAKP